MAINFPEGTQDLPAGTINTAIIDFSNRVTYSNSGSGFETICSGSYTKIGGTSTELLVTLNLWYYGENSRAGNTKIEIGGSTFYGGYNWGGYAGYSRLASYTYHVTGLSSGSKSWTISHQYRGFNVANPNNSDVSEINNSYRGPSTIFIVERA